MLTFYQWNKTFKTLSNDFVTHPQQACGLVVPKNDDLLINGYKRKARQSCKQKSISHHLKYQQKKANHHQQNQEKESLLMNPFNNMAIRQRLRTSSPEINDAIMSSLKISKINVTKCEAPINKYLRKKMKQTQIFTQRRGHKDQKALKTQKERKTYDSCALIVKANQKQKIKNKQKGKKSSLICYYSFDDNLQTLDQTRHQDKISNETVTKQSPLKMFFRLINKRNQIGKGNQSIPSKRPSKAESGEQQGSFLQPSIVKIGTKESKQRLWSKNRRSASHYKTSYGQTIDNQLKGHKKSLRTISHSWQNLDSKI